MMWRVLAAMSNAKCMYRGFRPDDWNTVINLMMQSEFRIGGIASRAAYEALCRDGLTSDEVWVKVAECDGRIGGFVAAVVDWKKYWVRFALTHPAIGVRIAWNLARRLAGRLYRPVRTGQPEAICAGGDEACGHPHCRSWHQSAPDIAKVVFIYVAPGYRGRHIGSRLYERLFSRLRTVGVSRCDARIDFANQGSVKLHREVGFSVEPAERSYFASVDL